jgi:hypothetical protein
VDLDEAAPAEHQRPDEDERRREQVAGVADDGPQSVHDDAAAFASLPPEVDKRGEKEPRGGEPEADQLGMVVAALLRGALSALDARRHARLQRALPPALRHARLLRRPAFIPSTAARVRLGSDPQTKESLPVHGPFAGSATAPARNALGI